MYAQESNYTTWRLAKMNLAICGIDGQIAHGDMHFIRSDATDQAVAVSRTWSS